MATNDGGGGVGRPLGASSRRRRTATAPSTPSSASPGGATPASTSWGSTRCRSSTVYGKKDTELKYGDCGGIYNTAPPRTNACKAPGEWQTYDVVFRAPRFDAAGKKTANARFVKVVLNGEVIHEDVAVEYPTGSAWRQKKETPTGPLLLQGDHGSVAFRNVRIRPLAEKKD